MLGGAYRAWVILICLACCLGVDKRRGCPLNGVGVAAAEGPAQAPVAGGPSVEIPESPQSSTEPEAQPAPVPIPEQEVEVPAPEPTEEIPAPESTIEIPAPEPTVEIPAPEPTVEIPAPEPTIEIPAPEPTVEIPAPEPTVQIPAPEPTIEIPAPEPTIEIPAPEPTVEIPAPEPTVEIPAPEPAIEIPAPAPLQGPSIPPEMAPNYEEDDSIVKGEIIVKVKPQENPYALNLDVKKVLGGLGQTFAVAKVPQNETIASTLVKAMSRPEVEYAEPNRIWKANVVPGDSEWSSQWNMRKIQAPEAWDAQKGSNTISVCVIDTGIDYNHADLEANMAAGALKQGLNAITGQNDCMDGNGHGTHCAGVIGAVTDNSIGVAGINWNIQLIGCKFLNAAGSGSTLDAIECLDWCVNTANTKISSNSWGGGGYSTALHDAIEAAGQNKNHLFVVAAGNSFLNIDSNPEYPAAYDLPNVLPVASTDSEDKLSYFSNYSPRIVPIAAPGSSILSTTPNNGYSIYSGTSMACPHVAGTAALMLAADSSLTYSEIIAYMVQGADQITDLNQYVAGGNRLNVWGAINAAASGQPIPSPSPPPPLPSPPPPVPLGLSETATLTPSQYPFLSATFDLSSGSTDIINSVLAEKCRSDFSARLQSSQYKKLIFELNLSQYSSSGDLEIDDCVQPSGTVDTMMMVFKCPVVSGTVDYASCTCYDNDDGCGYGSGEIVSDVPYNAADRYYTVLVPWSRFTSSGEVKVGIKDGTLQYSPPPPPPNSPPPPPGNVGVVPFDVSMTATSSYPQISISYDLSSGTTNHVDKTFLGECAEDVVNFLQSDRKKLIVQIKGLPSGGALTAGNCDMTSSWDSVSIALYCPQNSILCKCYANDDGCGTYAGADKIQGVQLEPGYILYYIVMGYSPSTSSGQFKIGMEGSNLVFPSPPPPNPPPPNPLPPNPPPPNPPPPVVNPPVVNPPAVNPPAVNPPVVIPPVVNPPVVNPPVVNPPTSGGGGGGGGVVPTPIGGGGGGGGGGVIPTPIGGGTNTPDPIPQVPEPNNEDNTPESTPEEEGTPEGQEDTPEQESDSPETPELTPEVIDKISPVVSMRVKLKLPDDKPCDSLTGSEKTDIESNFCKRMVEKKGLEKSNVECTASLSCSAARQSNSEAFMKTAFKVINKDLKSIDSANEAASNIKSSLEDTEQLNEVLDEVIPGAGLESVESIEVQEADLPPPPPPSPPPPPPPKSSPTLNPPSSDTPSSSKTCEYDGYYTIKPLYSPCSKYYLAYIYPRCKSTSVDMRRYKQIKGKPRRIHWQIESKEGIASIIGRERTECKARSLAAPSKISKGLSLGGAAWKWKIIPRKTSDCTKVNLYAFFPKKRGYLAVSSVENGCSMSYSKTKNSKPTMFRLSKRKS
ncbi:hypothetical protein M9435_002434 [Picochlorum sp. BPE23]|nr:hypothetical protein M9435_002434 [Picochlorum sp. BPE23]